MPSGAFAMRTKGNVVLYLDKELVEKSKDLGFNLSKTFENYLKHLMKQFSTVNSINNFELSENKLDNGGAARPQTQMGSEPLMGLPEFEPR
jgi:hypothetical protein